MTNKQVVKKIMNMDVWELLTWIMSDPTQLTDGYYSEFRTAIHKRYDELEATLGGSDTEVRYNMSYGPSGDYF